MKLISVTMKLFFWEKFHCDLKRWKMGRFKSLRFDFCVFNFDTMKVILFGKAPKSLMVSYFWQKEKERKYRINTCVPICQVASIRIFRVPIRTGIQRSESGSEARSSRMSARWVGKRLQFGYFRFPTRIEAQRSGFDSERRSKGAGGWRSFVP